MFQTAKSSILFWQMVDGKELYLYPCGLIATSVFNDTFTLSKNKELSTDKEVTPPPSFFLASKVIWTANVNCKCASTYDTRAPNADLNLIGASMFGKYSVGPSIRSICTRRCFTMINMVQACSDFY